MSMAVSVVIFQTPAQPLLFGESDVVRAVVAVQDVDPLLMPKVRHPKPRQINSAMAKQTKRPPMPGHQSTSSRRQNKP